MKKRLTVILLVAILLFAEGLIFTVVTQPIRASPAWWDTNWQYRRQITVGPHPENYQIKVVIPSEIPKSDYPSIRFFEDENSGLLPYWIENDENEYINVAWVRRLENEASNGNGYYYGGDTTIWMYYGNPGASSAENGDDVFIFFDDFGGNQLDSNKWAKSDTGVDVYDYALRLQDYNDDEGRIEHGPGQGLTTEEQNTRRIIEYRIKNTSTWRGGVGLEGPSWGFKEISEIFKDDGDNKFFVDGTWGTTAVEGNKWYIGQIIMYGANKKRINVNFYYGNDNANYRDLVENVRDWEFGDWAPESGGWYIDKYKLRVWDGSGDSTYYYDWFLVRKYVDTKPSVEVGSEESLSCEVDVTIENDFQESWPCTWLTFNVIVSNIGDIVDNYHLTAVDTTWPPENIIIEPANLENVAPGENRSATLHVHIPDWATPCTTKEIIVIAESQFCGATDNDNAIVHVIEEPTPWTGTATFSLVNLYTVNVEKILDLNQGSKLVVKFYTYGDGYESENVIETFSPPAHVEENELARHPGGIGVKKARLDLTTDDTSNVISTIESFTVTKTILELRFTQIPLEWALAPPAEKVTLEIEFSQIPLYWALAPS